MDKSTQRDTGRPVGTLTGVISSHRQSQHPSALLLRALIFHALLVRSLPLSLLAKLLAPNRNTWDSILSLFTIFVLKPLRLCHGGGIFGRVRSARVCAFSGISPHVSLLPMFGISSGNLCLFFRPMLKPSSLSFVHGVGILWGSCTGTLAWVCFVPLAFDLQVCGYKSKVNDCTSKTWFEGLP